MAGFNCYCTLEELPFPSISDYTDVLDPNSSVDNYNNVTERSTRREDPIFATTEAEDTSTREAETSLTDDRNTDPFVKGTWAFEWRPSIHVGLVKIPYEEIIRDRIADTEGSEDSRFLVNILSSTFTESDTFTITDSNRSIILPMNSDNLVVLDDVNLSRKLITNTTITQGTKYYQVFTENFPEISITLSAVKFGGISERVVAYFNAITKFASNPRRYPGSFYLYDVFKEQQETYSKGLFNNNHYKKYKILPNNINKTVTSNNNLMVQFTISGTVVEWGQNE